MSTTTASTGTSTPTTTPTTTEDEFKGAVKKIQNEYPNMYFDLYDNIKQIDEEYLTYLKDGTKGDKFMPYMQLLMMNMLYSVNKYLYIFSDNMLYHLGKIYATEYSYYTIFLNLFFILFLFVIVFILYWDYVYRTAAKSSRCTKITEIVDNNIPLEYPFMYSIVIIHENDMDNLLENFAMKINFDFIKKTTTVVRGDEDYLNDVKLPLGGVNSNADENKFAYYDLNDMKDVTMSDIDAEVLTGVKYKFIPMTPDNRRLYTDAAKELAEFVKEYGRNKERTPVYPIYNILNAAEQHNMKKY
jgi:hypothetical protein